MRNGLLVGAGLSLLMVGHGGQAWAEKTPVKDCLNAYENTQLLRRKEQFLEAKTQAQACSKESCRAALRSDCLVWLKEIDNETPTIILSAKTSVGEEFDVKVYVDDRLLVSKLDGSALAVNPGGYRIRFEAQGYLPVEQKIIIKVGEKNRNVSVDLKKIARTLNSASAASVSVPSIHPPPPVPTHRPVPTVVYALGGAAILATAGFVALGLSGIADKDKFEKTCAPFCSNGESSQVTTKFLLADVSLGIGVVSLAVAGYLWWTRPNVPMTDQARSPGGSWAVGWVPGGVVGRYTTPF
jgi:hypothetical protein